MTSKSITIFTPGGIDTVFITPVPVATQRVFEIAGNAALTLDGIYVSNGHHPAEGGNIHNQGTLILKDSSVLFGSSAEGAGVWNSGSLTIYDSYFTSNTAEGGRGGAIWSSTPVTIEIF